MDPEKTLLQQIREKEQEYAQKIEGVKKETALAVEAAKNEAEALLCTADGSGKAEAERLYWEGKSKIEAEIEDLKRGAVTIRETAMARGEKNQHRAIDAIKGYVTME
jgi:vacuolar-type H+-ATPase subunit H